MEKIQAYMIGETISSNSSEAYSLNAKSFFGEKKEDKIVYSPSEALFLVEKGKMEILSKKKKVESRSYHTSEIRCKGRGKVGKPRRLQFDQEAMDALKKWLEVRGEDDNPYVFITKKGLEVKQISGDTFNLWCNTIFESIVGRRVHPHLFRESRCTTLVVEQGKDIKIAQRLLGHNSSETTEIYVIRKDNDASDEAFV